MTKAFPLMLLVLCVINYFDLYNRLMNFLGMKQFVFTAKFSDRLIYEGRDLIRQKKQKGRLLGEGVELQERVNDA